MTLQRKQEENISEIKHPIWLEFELIWDFMAVLLTCKFEDDAIKKSEGAILRTTFFPL